MKIQLKLTTHVSSHLDGHVFSLRCNQRNYVITVCVCVALLLHFNEIIELLVREMPASDELLEQ